MKLSRTWVSVILIVALIFITGMTVKASTYSVPIIGYHEEEVDRAEGKVTGTALITDYDWSDVPLYIRIFKEGQDRKSVV